MGKYDVLDKEYFGSTEKMAELIMASIFRGRLDVDSGDLIKLDTKYPSLRAKSGEFERDAICRCDKHGIKYGIEIENYSDYTMPRRILTYDACEYERSAVEIRHNHRILNDLRTFEERKSGMLSDEKDYPIVDIVLYLGMGRYKGRRSMREMYNPIPEKIRRYVQDKLRDYSFVLLEADYVDPSCFRTELRQFFEAMQSRNDMYKLMDLLESDEYQELSEKTQKIIAIHLDDNDLMSKVVEENKTMCKAIRDLKRVCREEGKSEGIKEGIKEGRTEGILATFTDLVNEGLLTIDIAAEKVGKTVDEFQMIMEGRGNKAH